MRLKLLGPKVGKLPPGISFIDIAAWHWILRVCMPSLSRCVWLFAIHWTAACQAPLWDSPGKNTGVGCHAHLQGIFPTQGLNLHLLCLLHWQSGSWPLVPAGKPDTETYPCLNPCTTKLTGRGDISMTWVTDPVTKGKLGCCASRTIPGRHGFTVIGRKLQQSNKDRATMSLILWQWEWA